MSEPYGVLLVNLGTPDAPRPRELRRYLRQFLGDPRVLDMPRIARWLLLNLIILPTRPRKSAEAYQKVWTEKGSPLLLHSEALAEGVRRQLGETPVSLGMRYGKPDVASALDELVAAGVRRIVVLPLFPQFADAASGSALAHVRECAAARSEELTLLEVHDFYAHPGFVASWRQVAAPLLDAFEPDHVLLSYHGLPERQVTKADAHAHCLVAPGCCDAPGVAARGCYRAQCYATTRAMVHALELDPARCSTSFQSRLGRTPWILPHTDAVLPELHAAGVRRLAVLCPAFTADCLETLEEIGMQAREQWLSLGGEAFELVPCLNADPVWVDAVAQIVRERVSQEAT